MKSNFHIQLFQFLKLIFKSQLGFQKKCLCEFLSLEFGSEKKHARKKNKKICLNIFVFLVNAFVSYKHYISYSILANT